MVFTQPRPGANVGWALADRTVSVNDLVDETFAKMESVGLWERRVERPR
jgi:hypothetical protein